MPDEQPKRDPESQGDNEQTIVDLGNLSPSFDVTRVLRSPLSIGNALLCLVIMCAIIVFAVLAIAPTRDATQTGIDNAEYARGLITLMFLGGTMLIAVLLALVRHHIGSSQCS